MKKIIRLLLLIAMMISASFAMLSCTTDNNNEDPPANDGKVSYTLRMTDGAGNPITEGLVTAFSGETNVGMKRIGDTGTVVFELKPGTYTLTFDNVPEGLVVNGKACVFTETIRELDVIFYNKTTPSQSVWASPFDDGEGKNYSTRGVTEGVYFVELDSSDMNYFIFTPERDGVYRVSVTADNSVDVGCYGGPMFVMSHKSLPMDGDDVIMTIKPSYIGDSDRETTKYVFGIFGEADGCVLSIVREGDYVKTPEDEMWIDVSPSGKLDSFNIEYDNYAVTSLDVTDKNLKVVFNTSDGFYHLGTADGPVVLVRIASPSPYLASFVDICDVTRFGAYIYDEDGSFDRKESYNTLIYAYASVADAGSGLYPLNDQLANMIKVVGEYNKWWDFSTERHIFGDSAPSVVAENAWLFACCYVEYDPTLGSTEANAITAKPIGKISIAPAATLNFTSSDFDDVLLTVSDPSGIYKVAYGGNEYTAKDGKIIIRLSGTKNYTVTRTDATGENAIMNYTCERIISAEGELRLISGTTLYFTSAEEGSYTLTITDLSGYVKVTYDGKEYFADAKGKLTVTVDEGKSFTIERTDTAATELKVKYTFAKN